MSPHKPIYVYADEERARTSTNEIIPRLRASFPDRAVLKADTDSFLELLAAGEAAMAVLPGIGGEKCHYHDLLGGAAGMRIMDSYIRQGGLLMTACAGSYYVSARTEWIPPWSASRGRENLHPLFNGTARGPVAGFGEKPTSAVWYEDFKMVPVLYKTPDNEWMRTDMAYGNGPALHIDAGKEDGIEILARYETVPGQPVAAAWRDMGRGAVLWLGVLPYLGPQPLPPQATERQSRTITELQRHEPARAQFWDMLAVRLQRRMHDSPAVTTTATPARPLQVATCHL